MPGPLHGFTVVEATQMVSGPLAAMLLADQGADVIKLEQPVGGDRLRYLGNRRGGIGAFWANCNRGKRSLVLDLQQADGVGRAAPPGGARRRVPPELPARRGRPPRHRRGRRCAPCNPDLVYVSISGFGESGPYIDQKSYDYVIQALSGMAALQADPATGEPSLVRNIVIDKATAYTAAQAVTAALLARERGAGGQHVRIAMIDVALAFLWPDGMMQHTLLGDGVHEAPHMADGYLVRPTADGYLSVMATSDRQFPLLCRALGTRALGRRSPLRDAWPTARPTPPPSTSCSAPSSRGTRAPSWSTRLHAHDVPCALIRPVAEVHLDPQVQHNDVLVEHERPWIGAVREPKPAPAVRRPRRPRSVATPRGSTSTPTRCWASSGTPRPRSPTSGAGRRRAPPAGLTRPGTAERPGIPLFIGPVGTVRGGGGRGGLCMARPWRLQLSKMRIGDRRPCTVALRRPGWRRSRRPRSSLPAPSAPERPAPLIHLLHIMKTGGTSLTNALLGSGRASRRRAGP